MFHYRLFLDDFLKKHRCNIQENSMIDYFDVKIFWPRQPLKLKFCKTFSIHVKSPVGFESTVAIIIWARTSCVLTLRDDRFRMRIALGVVLICSLVCAKRNLGRLRSGPVLTGSVEVHPAAIESLRHGCLSY